MKWKNIFKPVAKLSSDEARSFMGERSAGDYQLIDVRQPKEYENQHIPGSRLIPLAELPNRLDELERDKSLIAYCAVGRRSKAAAQFLSEHGFEEVYNLSGGIKEWSGEKATGALEQGLAWFQGDEDYRDAIHLAYAMEDGLQRFYEKLADATKDEKEQTLFKQLAGFEEKHKTKLVDEYQRVESKILAPDGMDLGVMESGALVEDMLRGKFNLVGPADVLGFAMSLEVQAYDLYGRMAAKSTRESTKSLFVSIMDEERAHLARLAVQLDCIL